jgi:HK97 family phage prohead protease
VSDTLTATRPPRENLVRAMPGDCKLRSAGTGKPTMVGHFAVFNQWAEINSAVEGHFMERVAPGAFAKTIRENRDRIKCLFHHGLDPQIGIKVLGPVAQLGEDEEGVFFEVPLLDTSYIRDLLPGLEAGEYGSSFRFTVIRDEFVGRPRASESNPHGIPERTLTELKLKEFGPTPFPAYGNATAGLRSITDDIILSRFAEDPERLQQVAERAGVAFPTAIREDDGESRMYMRSAETVGDSLWAITPGALATILSIIAERRAGYKPTKEEIQERIGTRDDAPAPVSSTVAVIPITGPIFPRANLMTDVSGATSIQGLQTQFRDALANEQVSAILFDINSPGGSADLVPEFASEIMAARGEKPIVAVANTLAASAAYWIAAACDELVVTPSGDVGSIGVYSAHDDISAAQDKLGVKTTLVSAGKYKVEKSPFAPLSEEAQAEMQRRVDVIHDMFVAAVSAGRGVSEKKVRDGFGQGRVVMANDAVAAKMADRVATFDETLRRLERDATRSLDARKEPEPQGATTRQPERADSLDAAHTRTSEPTARKSTSAPTHGAKEVPSWKL